VDRLFLGVDGVDSSGLTTPDVSRAKLNSAHIRVARRCRGRRRHKFGAQEPLQDRRSRGRHRVITDRKISVEMQRALKAAGIDIVIA